VIGVQPRHLWIGIPASLLVVGAGLWLAWPGSNDARHESTTQAALFPFSQSGGEAKTLRVDLPLSRAAIRGADHVRSAVTFEFEEIAAYQQSASGEVSCYLQVFVDDARWFDDRQHFQVSSVSPSQWQTPSGNKNWKQTTPSYDDSDILSRLGGGSDHALRASWDCTSTVSTTGPTSVRVTLGPLFAMFES
jgi:hypothetical protein